MKKGFSLFTPLVGTAVVIITITMAVVMIQNDVRISRGLTASYEVSAQTISSKLIKAAAEVQIVENIAEAIKAVLPSEFIITCNSETSCKSAMKDKISDILGSEITLGSHGIYFGVVENIEVVTDYEPINQPCSIEPSCNSYSDLSLRFDCCLSNALIQTTRAVNIDMERNLRITIDNSNMDPNAFSVAFQNKRDSSDRITLSIIPHKFSHETTIPINQQIEKSTKAFIDSLSSKNCQSVSGANQVKMYKDNDGNIKLSVKWDQGWGANKVMILSFQNKDFTSLEIASITPFIC